MFPVLDLLIQPPDAARRRDVVEDHCVWPHQSTHVIALRTKPGPRQINLAGRPSVPSQVPEALLEAHLGIPPSHPVTVSDPLLL